MISNATIHPVSRPSYVGSLFIEKGKIVEAEPKDATRIDGSGLSVYPGLIDAHTYLGLKEIGSINGTVDAFEIGSLQPDLKALSAVNPHSELIPVTRMNGITSVLSLPSGGLISGQSAVIRLDGWTPTEMALKEIFALHVSLPEPPEKEKDKGKEEKKPDADAQDKPLREMFQAARRYDPKDPDPRLEALQPYLRGERPVVFEAGSIRQIKASLKFAEEIGLKPVISGGRDAWKIASLLAEKKVPVILTGVMEIPHEQHDPADALASSAAKLIQAGVKVAISSAEDFHGGSRNTPYHASWSAAHGLDRAEALKTVTLYPAEILGIADRVGTLDAGKDADLIITTGDPLEVVTDVVYEFIKGRPVLLESKHTRLYEKFRQRTEKK